MEAVLGSELDVQSVKDEAGPQRGGQEISCEEAGVLRGRPAWEGTTVDIRRQGSAIASPVLELATSHIQQPALQYIPIRTYFCTSAGALCPTRQPSPHATKLLCIGLGHLQAPRQAPAAGIRRCI